MADVRSADRARTGGPRRGVRRTPTRATRVHPPARPGVAGGTRWPCSPPCWPSRCWPAVVTGSTAVWACPPSTPWPWPRYVALLVHLRRRGRRAGAQAALPRPADRPAGRARRSADLRQRPLRPPVEPAGRRPLIVAASPPGPVLVGSRMTHDTRAPTPRPPAPTWPPPSPRPRGPSAPDPSLLPAVGGGRARPGELAEYAVHYRAFEAVLPEVLAVVVDRLRPRASTAPPSWWPATWPTSSDTPSPTWRCSTNSPPPCPTAPSATGPAAAARELVDTYRDLARQSPGRRHRRPGRLRDAGRRHRRHQGRRPAPLVRDRRRRHRASGTCTPRWTPTTATGPSRRCSPSDADPVEVAEAARRAADAWWALLDEREAEAAVAA